MITWIMVFAFYYPSINEVILSEMHDFNTKAECLETLDKQFEFNVKQGYLTEHMTGWCYETAPKVKTLEYEGARDNKKPELLK